MPGSRFARIVVAAALLAAGLTPALLDTGAVTAGAASCPWMDRHKSPDERGHELVKAMTLDQKIAELYGRGDFSYYGAANDITASDAGFGTDTNRVVLIDCEGAEHLPLMSKYDVSSRLLDKLLEVLRTSGA